MISKALFVKMMNFAEEFIEETDRWIDFGIEVIEMPITEIPWGMFQCWADSHFDLEGRDWISWYLWERKSINTGKVLACYHEDGTEFYVNTPEDLWALVEPHIVKPCFNSICPINPEPCIN